MKVWKFTDCNMQTGVAVGTPMTWGPGVTNTVTKWNEADFDRVGVPWLCSASWIHCYEHPMIALACHARHIKYGHEKARGILWECETPDLNPQEGIYGRSAGDKMGVMSLTTVKPIARPCLTAEQATRLAVRIALLQSDSNPSLQPTQNQASKILANWDGKRHKFPKWIKRPYDLLPTTDNALLAISSKSKTGKNQRELALENTRYLVNGRPGILPEFNRIYEETCGPLDKLCPLTGDQYK